MEGPGTSGPMTGPVAGGPMTGGPMTGPTAGGPMTGGVAPAERR